jgi:hypothetical protein
VIFSAGIGLIEASSMTSMYPYPDASDNDLIEAFLIAKKAHIPGFPLRSDFRSLLRGRTLQKHVLS